MIPTLTRVVAKDEQQFVENKEAYDGATFERFYGIFACNVCATL